MTRPFFNGDCFTLKSCKKYFKCLLLLSICVGLGACSSNPDAKRQIETYDDIVMTEEQDTTRFNYTMYWILPNSTNDKKRLKGLTKRVNKQEYMLSQMGRRNPELNNIRLNGEIKVRLEDIAVAKLARKLQIRGLCPDGYDIEQTYWQEKSIKLLGQCF